MSRRERFELAFSRYRDVSDQLRRWEAVQVAAGMAQADAKEAAHKHIGEFGLFDLQDAMTDFERGPSPATSEALDRELARFEAALEHLQQTLASEGVPM